MTTAIQETKVRALRDSFDYGPMPYGKNSGVPTVSVKLSSSESNTQRAGSIEGLFDNYNWKSKVSSGFARMRIHGNDPLSEEHERAISALNELISPTFLDVEIQSRFLDKEPTRHIKTIADSFSLFVPLDKSYDEDVFQWFSEQANSYGNVQFLFKIDGPTDRKRIKNISHEYNIYDSDIWLYPKGVKPDTVSDRMDDAVKMAKTNTWNVSPRMDILQEYDAED